MDCLYRGDFIGFPWIQKYCLIEISQTRLESALLFQLSWNISFSLIPAKPSIKRLSLGMAPGCCACQPRELPLGHLAIHEWTISKRKNCVKLFKPVLLNNVSHVKRMIICVSFTFKFHVKLWWWCIYLHFSLPYLKAGSAFLLRAKLLAGHINVRQGLFCMSKDQCWKEQSAFTEVNRGWWRCAPTNIS